MSFEKINKIASSVSQFLTDNEKISVPILAVRVRKALQEFPEDQTIVAMAQVLTRMSSNKSFITRGELKKMAQGFYSRNTRFNEIFASELGPTSELASPTYYKRDEVNEEALQDFADPVLANALASAFEKNQPLKNYSAKAALASVRKVSQMFAACGIECKATVATGTPDIIIIEASFESPKGQTNVFVPVEIHENSVLEPSVFVSNRGSEEFTSENVVSYAKGYAGNRLVLRASDLLAVVEKIKTGGKQSVSGVELAITKMKAASQTQSDFFANQITGLSVEDTTNTVTDVALPKLQDSELDTFAAKFDTAVGQANFKFGERKMISVRSSVEFALRSCGIKSAQLAVADCNEGTVTFAISVGKTAFTVPVKMTTASPVADVFICNGRVRALDRSNLEMVMAKQETDFRAAAVASPLYSVKPSELVETVRTAMSERNLAKAEDALNVLASSGDVKAYGIALSAYMTGLGHTKVATASAKAECACTRIISTASSKHPICGHTGLPLHKVYQDPNGDCHPLYRKGMDESYEGAAFMTNKIFL